MEISYGILSFIAFSYFSSSCLRHFLNDIFVVWSHRQKWWHGKAICVTRLSYGMIENLKFEHKKS